MSIHIKTPRSIVAHTTGAGGAPGIWGKSDHSDSPNDFRHQRGAITCPLRAQTQTHSGGKTLMSIGQLAILTVVAVASLRSLPAMADYGLASVLLYLIPAVFFLVPTALVSAELATGWKGGVYVWGARSLRQSRWIRGHLAAVDPERGVVPDSDLLYRSKPVVRIRFPARWATTAYTWPW